MNIYPFDLSVSDFVAQSAKWCKEFNIPEDFPYDLKVEIADRALFDAGLEKYEQIEQEADIWFDEEHNRQIAALPTYSSQADFIVRIGQWRDEFKIPKFLPYAEQVRMAEEVLRSIDRAKYADMLSAAEEWSEKERANLNVEPPFDNWKEQIRRQLMQIQAGKYLMIYLPYGSSNYTIEQGTLTSVDWHNGSVVLHSTNYNRDTTVWIDRIQSIDESRSGSGANRIGAGTRFAPGRQRLVSRRYQAVTGRLRQGRRESA
jgi:hypothetical protein